MGIKNRNPRTYKGNFKYRCLAVDFDATLAYLKGGPRELFKIFTKQGIKEKDIARLYHNFRNNAGFEIGSFLKYLKNQKKIKFDDQRAKKDFNIWLKKSLKVYPEVRAWLGAVSRKIPVIIVTAGHPKYQKLKIKLAGLERLGLAVTSPSGSKVTVLNKLAQRHGKPVLFIDDNVSELDDIRRAGFKSDTIKTIRIMRRQSPHRTKKAFYKHRTVRVLKDLWKI